MKKSLSQKELAFISKLELKEKYYKAREVEEEKVETSEEKEQNQE